MKSQMTISSFTEYQRRVIYETEYKSHTPHYWGLFLSEKVCEFGAAVGNIMANRIPGLEQGVFIALDNLGDMLYGLNALVVAFGFDLWQLAETDEIHEYTHQQLPILLGKHGERLKSFPFMVVDTLGAAGRLMWVVRGGDYGGIKQEYALDKLQELLRHILRCCVCFGYELGTVAERGLLRNVKNYAN